MNYQHRVLIIDDELGIQRTLQELLSMEGYEVRAVRQGQEGLDILRAWRPEAIILDLRMPVMDGPSFREAQRQLGDGLAAIPVILLSGSRDVEDQADVLDAAAAIPKPFDLDIVLAVVAQTIEHATVPRPHA